MRSTASSLLASVLVAAGGAIGGPPVLAAPWTSTIGEPLRDSSPQALELTQHLMAIGAEFYGAWTCPACFKQMNLFGKQAGADLTYVECRKPEQLPDQADACIAAEIRATPPGFSPMDAEKLGFSPWKPWAAGMA
ncbi:hypothetical protein [Synechococcus sp. CC9605]|uniref:hypothetical protein n=1 Tax=Synechococcus sp. (strain CC9605) TaxID=110662 RepID=UPI00005D574F|nr:hypothetical protein [Synechococcus sp. CC9605]ABB34279.1 conserved hypothetical protein [Synechococcus sp. CC9605]